MVGKRKVFVSAMVEEVGMGLSTREKRMQCHIPKSRVVSIATSADISHLTLAPLHQRAMLVSLYPLFQRTRPTNGALVRAVAPKDRVAALERQVGGPARTVVGEPGHRSTSLVPRRELFGKRFIPIVPIIKTVSVLSASRAASSGTPWAGQHGGTGSV